MIVEQALIIGSRETLHNTHNVNSTRFNSTKYTKYVNIFKRSITHDYICVRNDS